jgi:hypothetical protein
MKRYRNIVPTHDKITAISDRGRRKGTTGAPPAIRRGHPLELIVCLEELL